MSNYQSKKALRAEIERLEREWEFAQKFTEYYKQAARNAFIVFASGNDRYKDGEFNVRFDTRVDAFIKDLSSVVKFRTQANTLACQAQLDAEFRAMANAAKTTTKKAAK